MNLYLYILHNCTSEFMDNIKKDFIHSLVDNVDDQSIDQNNKLNVNNKIEYDNIEITQPCFMSHVTNTEDSNYCLIRKIQSLEEENDRLLSIIENKNVIINESLKFKNNSKIDVETTKILQLNKTVQDLMNELQTIKSSVSGDNERNKNSIEIKQLNDKLNLSNKKICNYRDQIMQLKNDLQITQNALSNEIGDPSLMQAVLSGTGSSNSRGRAQQILVLQQRVNELESIQNNSGNKDTLKSNVSMRHMEKTRRAITDQTLKDVQSKVSKLTKSLEIWKNRSKALDVEITALRVQIQKLLSKSEIDNQLIDKLKADSSNNNKIQKFKTKNSIIKLEESIKLLQSKIEKAEQIIEQQASSLADRDMKIAHLESKILNHNETITNCDIYKMDFSDPKDIFIKNLNGFENQQLMDLLCVAHNKICEQAKIVIEFKTKFLMEKQKLQKLESKIGFYSTPTSSKRKSNNVSYHLKNELNPNEKLMELQNKLELAEEECAALKERLNTITMINKENVQMFAKALNDMKQQCINN